MESVLETCCGSPAYAAPELVSGRLYLGREVDVWSMGVLLYALLCGFLPFEDASLANLYRKIQRGTYYVPDWLSPASVSLLAGLMRVEPTQRLTLDQLRRHPWVTANGVLESVSISRGSFNDNCSDSGTGDNAVLDNDCVTELSVQCGVSRTVLRCALLKWRYDDLTAAYLLLHNRKARGLAVRLLRAPPHLPADLAPPAASPRAPPFERVLRDQYQLPRLPAIAMVKQQVVKKHSSLRRPPQKHQSPAVAAQRGACTPPSGTLSSFNFELPDASFVHFDAPDPSSSPVSTRTPGHHRAAAPPAEKENFIIPHTPRPRVRLQQQQQPRSPSCPADVNARRGYATPTHMRPMSVALHGYRSEFC